MKNKYSYLLFTIFILWMTIGAFPLFCYEGDSNSVIAGCGILFNEGFNLPPLFSYRYDMQPGTSLLILGLKYLFPFIATSSIYALLTLLSGIAFVLLTLFFVRVYVKTDLWIFILSLFLLPESFAIITYPNSSIIAAALFMGSLLCLQKGKYPWTIFLLLLASVIRIDIIIVYPVILPVLLMMNNTIKSSLLKSIGIAVLFLALVVSVYLLLRANPFSVVKVAEGYNDSASLLKPVLIANLAYYSINIVIIPLGLLVLCKKKEYKVALMSLIPILLVHFFYRLNSTAPKHFLYTLPFDLIIVASFWKQLLKDNSNKSIKVIAMILIVLFSITSVRLRKPYTNTAHLYMSESGRWDFFSKEMSDITFKVGLGVGQIVGTADEYMALTGNLFYPLYIHNVKSHLSHNLDVILNNIKGKDVKVINVSYMDHYTLANTLLEKGYSYNKLNDDGSFYSLIGEKKLTFELYEVQEKEDMERLLVSFSDKASTTYIMTQYGHYMDRCDELVEKGVLKEQVEGLYSFEKQNN